MNSELPRVVIQTELGEIELEVDTTSAPVTAANFLRYVDEGYYQESSFYRTVKPDNQPQNDVKIEVIQGGLGMDYDESVRPRYAPITLERTSVTGLRHQDGTISMARLDPNSARTEFFICIGDQPELDYNGRRYADGLGFAAFGHVVSGFDVVRQIQQAPLQAQNLTPAIKISSIYRK